MTRAGFVEVPRHAIVEFLKAKGFEEISSGRSELVYERRHHRDPSLRVRVYTSVQKWATDARGRGEDAIRVVVVRDDDGAVLGVAGPRSRVRKLARIHRTGSVEKVLVRLLERMRDAYAIANGVARVREGQRIARQATDVQRPDDPDSHTGHIPRFHAGSP